MVTLVRIVAYEHADICGILTTHFCRFVNFILISRQDKNLNVFLKKFVYEKWYKSYILLKVSVDSNGKKTTRRTQRFDIGLPNLGNFIDYGSYDISYMSYGMTSTLIAIIFLHYMVATKMALEIFGYTMCRVRLGWLV